MWTTLICLWHALSGMPPHGRTTHRRPAFRRPPSRPLLEALEDRLAPATLTWIGKNSQLWSDPDNWVEHITPYTVRHGEFIDLKFPRGGVSQKVSEHDLPQPVTLNSITFEDPGFKLTGGEISFRGGNITNAIPSGTNRIENATLDTGVAFDCQGNSTLEVTSSIVGLDLLAKFGTGTLSLAGNSSYQGGTELREGTITVGSRTALGVGILHLFDGTLQSSREDFLDNPVDVGSPPRVTAPTISGSNRINFTGTVHILAGATLTVAGSAAFFGDISGLGGLATVGNGAVTLGGDNSYTGGTNIQDGSVTVAHDNALGQGPVTLRGGELVGWALAPSPDSKFTLPNRFDARGGKIGPGLNDLIFTGAGTLWPGVTLTVITVASVTFSGPIDGDGGLTIIGDNSVTVGRVTLSGNTANTFIGTTTVTGGTLVLKKSDRIDALAGPLVIGDGKEAKAVVSLDAHHQIADTAPVTILSDGQFKMNNFDDKINLRVNKGKVTTGDPPTLTVAFDEVTATSEGEIEGPGTVVKDGTGTWILSGANTYTGGTVVNGGTLLVNSSVVGPVTVNAGATLGGTGTTGPVTLGAGAALSPGGADPAVQRVQDLVLSPESSYVVQVNGPAPGSGYDQLDVTGTVRLNGATLDASLGFSPDPGNTFVVIKNDGADPVDGTFAGLPQGAVVRISGVAFHIYYDRGDGNDVALVRNVPPAVTVPGDQAAFQNVDLALSGVRVDDPDDANLTVTLQVSHGTLTLGPVAGLSVGGNGTSSVSLSGSQAALNAALAGLLYRADLNYSGPDVLTVTADDGLNATSASVAIQVKSLAEQAADLQARVNALRAAGVLNAGRANSLLVKLNLKNNNGDIGRVQSFLNEVDALLTAGLLTQLQAGALLGPANILLLGLRRR